MPRRTKAKKHGKGNMVSALQYAADFALQSAAAACTTADDFKTLGNRFFIENAFEESIRMFSKAIDLDPAMHALYSNRSGAYLALGSFDRALADAKMCVEMDETWPKGYYRQGEALRSLGRNIDATASFQEGLDLDPENALLKAAMAALPSMKQDAMTAAEAECKAADGGAEDDKFLRLNKWLVDSGAVFPHIYMKLYSENNRGVHANKAIPSDEEILRIPRQCLMTVEMGKATAVGVQMVQSATEVSIVEGKQGCSCTGFAL